MRPEKGFTLIEVVVASTASTILAGAVFSMMYLVTSGMEASVAGYNLAQKYEITMDYLRSEVRKAYLIKSTEIADALGPTIPADTLATNRGGSIHAFTTCAKNGATIRRFRFEAVPCSVPDVTCATLRHTTNSGSWTTFRIGSDSALFRLTPLTILAGRRGVSIDLRFITVEDGAIVEQLNSTKEMIRCRNGYF